MTCETSDQWMVMVHGFTQNHHVFDRQVCFLKSYTNILLVDLRGHGDSPDGLGAYGIEEYVDDLEAVLLQKDIRDSGGFPLWEQPDTVNDHIKKELFD